MHTVHEAMQRQRQKQRLRLLLNDACHVAVLRVLRVRSSIPRSIPSSSRASHRRPPPPTTTTTTAAAAAAAVTVAVAVKVVRRLAGAPFDRGAVEGGRLGKLLGERHAKPRRLVGMSDILGIMLDVFLFVLLVVLVMLVGLSGMLIMLELDESEPARFLLLSDGDRHTHHAAVRDEPFPDRLFSGQCTDATHMQDARRQVLWDLCWDLCWGEGVLCGRLPSRQW